MKPKLGYVLVGTLSPHATPHIAVALLPSGRHWGLSEEPAVFRYRREAEAKRDEIRMNNDDAILHIEIMPLRDWDQLRIQELLSDQRLSWTF